MDVGADVGVGVDADVMNNDVYSKRVDVNVAVDRMFRMELSWNRQLFIQLKMISSLFLIKEFK